MGKPVTIIIPAFNQLAYCQECVSTVLMNTLCDYKLVLVDNASTDGVAEFFDSVPGAEVVHAETNRGFAGGVNLGLELAEGHVLLLNSDTIVPAGWLERLLAALGKSAEIGMVGPMSNYASGCQQIEDLDLRSMDDVNSFACGLAKAKDGALRDVDRLVGFCLLIRDAVVEQVGGFDESFGLGNFEDDDYCLRVKRAGYRLCVAEDSFVFHYGNRTFLGMGLVGERWDRMLAANQLRFFDKWDIKPDKQVEAAQESMRLNALAREAHAKGALVDAVRLLKQAIETFAYLEVNFNDLGAILWEMGKPEQAFDNFARAVQLNPAHIESRENLLQAALALGRESEAMKLLLVEGKGRAERLEGDQDGD